MGFIAVFLGGSIGATLRYFLASSLGFLSDSFWATFLINVLGSMFLGFVSYLVIKNKENFRSELKLFLTTGIAGGFTTFSTFNYEIFSLFQANRVMMGVAYMFLSLFAGLFAIMLGMLFAKRIMEFAPNRELAFDAEAADDNFVQESDSDELVEV